MSLFLVVLKWIGIILLVIISLLILLLILVMFVPIRYRVTGRYVKEPTLDLKAHWLLHAVNIRIRYKDGKLSSKIKVLGFSLGKFFNKKEFSENVEKVSDSVKDTAKEGAYIISNQNKDDNEHHLGEELLHHNEKKEDENIIPVQTKKKKQKKKKRKKDKKEGLFTRIKRFFLKLLEKLVRLKESIRDIWEKISNVYQFFTDNENKKGFRVLKKYFYKLLKHIKPRKMNMKIEFGTGDPCNTGIALGAISTFYPLFKDQLKIVPYFDDKVFLCEGTMKGRIRTFTVAKILIQLYINKEFKKLWKKFNKMKEEVGYGR